MTVSLAVLIAGTVWFVGGDAGDALTHHDASQVPPAVIADARPDPGVPEAVGVFLQNGQAWRAARVMRDYLRDNPDAPPSAILLAARAEAGWGGWDRVRRYLDGRPWLDDAEGGEGWYWLARALEHDEEWEPAAQAYERYLAARGDSGGDDRRTAAELRRGLVLLRLDRDADAIRSLQQSTAELPEIAKRIDALAAEALAPGGDTARVRVLTAGLLDDSELRGRAQRARLRAYEEADDPAGALALAQRYRAAAAGAAERAGYALSAGQMARVLGDMTTARRELRDAVALSPGSAAAGTAASLLEEMGSLTNADRLALARSFDARGVNGKAASHYRAWLAAEAGTAAERNAARQALGQVLFDSGDYAAAISAVGSLESPEALYLIGRAQYRRGNSNAGREAFLGLARRYPGNRLASEGLFLVADLDHDDMKIQAARPIYRQVADDFRGSDRAGLSLMRLAGIAYQERDYAAAARIWEEYRTSYPTGQRWLESTYWAARAREAAGDRTAAEALYRAARTREPLSYYALRASERLGVAFWPPSMGAEPPRDAAAEQRVAGWMRGIDVLSEAGLYAEAEAEADDWIREAGDNRGLLYPLAEALNTRGLTVRGIRIGIRLQGEGPLNPRLLRIVYPFPYRPMLEAEAGEKRLDPFVVAALIRQESLFKARISSPVGARGLMQIMPETGRGVAGSAGIDEWEPELLFQPEINAHLGTIFLAEQMTRWNASLPAVFSAYNAGPHRVEVWQRFPEYGDEELFTERIPYRETRDYVKILTRNIAIYRGLYGETGDREGGPGGTTAR